MHKHHPRHDHRAPIGAALLKIGLHLAGSLIKKKLAERMDAKRVRGSSPRRS